MRQESFNPSDCRFCESPKREDQVKLFLQTNTINLARKRHKPTAKPEFSHKNHFNQARPPTLSEARRYYGLTYRLRKDQNCYPADNDPESLVSNIAFASLKVDGLNCNLVSSSHPELLNNIKQFEDYKVIIGDSIKDFENILETGYLRKAIKQDFSHKENIYDRWHDTEFKILEYITRELWKLKTPNRMIEGSLEIFSERRVCESCASVIKLFKQIFPKIELTIIEGYGDHVEYSQDGIKYPTTQQQVCQLRRNIAGMTKATHKLTALV